MIDSSATIPEVPFCTKCQPLLAAARWEARTKAKLTARWLVPNIRSTNQKWIQVQWSTWTIYTEAPQNETADGPLSLIWWNGAFPSFLDNYLSHGPETIMWVEVWEDTRPREYTETHENNICWHHISLGSELQDEPLDSLFISEMSVWKWALRPSWGWDNQNSGGHLAVIWSVHVN